MLTDDLRSAFETATRDLSPSPELPARLSRRLTAARRRRRSAYAGIPALAAAGSAMIVLAPGGTDGARPQPGRTQQRAEGSTALVAGAPIRNGQGTARGVRVTLSGYRVTLPAEVARRAPAGAPRGQYWIEIVTTKPDLSGATKLSVPDGAIAYVSRLNGRTTVLYRIPPAKLDGRIVWAVLPLRDATPEQVAAWFRQLLDS